MISFALLLSLLARSGSQPPEAGMLIATKKQVIAIDIASNLFMALTFYSQGIELGKLKVPSSHADSSRDGFGDSGLLPKHQRQVVNQLMVRLFAWVRAPCLAPEDVRQARQAQGEGAGGGHAPDIMKVAGLVNVLP